MWALLPVKRLQGAKKRLSPILSEDERSGLARAMLTDVLAALEAADNLDGIAIVTDDEDAIQMGEAAGHTILKEPDAGGLNGALSHGLQALMNKGARSVFIIHGDVPAVMAGELVEFPGGTNGMVLSPPDCIPMLYGKDSANKHVAMADQMDIPVEHVALEGLGLDIDHPEDLLAFLNQAPEGATMDYLLATGLDKRLKEPNQTN